MAEIKQGGDQFSSRWGLIATVLGISSTIYLVSICCKPYPTSTKIK